MSQSAATNKSSTDRNCCWIGIRSWPIAIPNSNDSVTFQPPVNCQIVMSTASELPHVYFHCERRRVQQPFQSGKFAAIACSSIYTCAPPIPFSATGRAQMSSKRNFDLCKSTSMNSEKPSDCAYHIFFRNLFVLCCCGAFGQDVLENTIMLCQCH